MLHCFILIVTYADTKSHYEQHFEHVAYVFHSISIVLNTNQRVVTFVTLWCRYIHFLFRIVWQFIYNQKFCLCEQKRPEDILFLLSCQWSNRSIPFSLSFVFFPLSFDVFRRKFPLDAMFCWFHINIGAEKENNLAVDVQFNITYM